jgi:DNA helicase TIP49 (TBP-interacting protein)
MSENLFYQAVNDKAKEIGINPILLLAGIEGLYTFKDTPLNQINYDFLDSLIITIFTLRIGDQFHALAEENLKSSNIKLQLAAIEELTDLTPLMIEQSGNTFLQSFAQIVNGKTPIRKYHEKALEVAAMEVQKAQQHFQEKSIGAIVMEICRNDIGEKLDLSAVFG